MLQKLKINFAMVFWGFVVKRDRDNLFLECVYVDFLKQEYIPCEIFMFKIVL